MREHEPQRVRPEMPRKLVVFTPGQLAALRALAQAQGHGNVSAVLRQAVDEYVARHSVQPRLWEGQ